MIVVKFLEGLSDMRGQLSQELQRVEYPAGAVAGMYLVGVVAGLRMVL